jgi:hypothetical protein
MHAILINQVNEKSQECITTSITGEGAFFKEALRDEAIFETTGGTLVSERDSLAT